MDKTKGSIAICSSRCLGIITEELLDEYGEQYNYKFQHAMNGGEILIEELGYFPDGLDVKKKTVIEIDERHHFRNGCLREKDIVRQREIEKLGYKFIRIKLEKQHG